MFFKVQKSLQPFSQWWLNMMFVFETMIGHFWEVLSLLQDILFLLSVCETDFWLVM